MDRKYRMRLITTLFVLLFIFAVPFSQSIEWPSKSVLSSVTRDKALVSLEELEKLDVKGRAPKTGYSRAEFGDGWLDVAGCDMRNIILARDLENERVGTNCKVTSGTLSDPYTAKTIEFQRGTETSDDVQIDHVVALSNAWQTGAQQLSFLRREAFANDPLNLLATDGDTNQQKSDGDAATWLPPNKAFRCQYVARQIKVKVRYELWVTPAEKEAMQRVLAAC